MTRQMAPLVPIRKMKRSRGPVFSLIAALLVLTAAVIWTLQHRDNRTRQSGDEPLRHDFDTVWSWGQSAFKGGSEEARWSFRWDGTTSLKAAKLFAERLGFTLSSNAGSKPVDIMAANPAHKMTLWLHPQQAADGTSTSDYELVLLFDAVQPAEQSSIRASLGSIEAARNAARIQLQGGFSVKGTSASADAASRIVRLASAREMESYDDGHTSSLTYYTPDLELEVQSGSSSVNLQIAVSHASKNQAEELIFGVPLITGDYTVQDK
ncbi:YwmB family TATA-box binding protein [Paenibacillus sp. R14(2021)]|uniref:YwmB family TATA-box binding protein n=1 Tax=Paenibacillus sp. R14(2021) TaxID=2859228 RepID=UPI001C614FF5|nr:YwmB family TATA-box binding protein [Paenibacillus sp. R14(2021)]